MFLIFWHSFFCFQNIENTNEQVEHDERSLKIQSNSEIFIKITGLKEIE